MEITADCRKTELGQVSGWGSGETGRKKGDAEGWRLVSGGESRRASGVKCGFFFFKAVEVAARAYVTGMVRKKEKHVPHAGERGTPHGSTGWCVRRGITTRTINFNAGGE